MHCKHLTKHHYPCRKKCRYIVNVASSDRSSKMKGRWKILSVSNLRRKKSENNHAHTAKVNNEVLLASLKPHQTHFAAIYSLAVTFCPAQNPPVFNSLFLLSFPAQPMMTIASGNEDNVKTVNNVDIEGAVAKIFGSQNEDVQDEIKSIFVERFSSTQALFHAVRRDILFSNSTVDNMRSAFVKLWPKRCFKRQIFWKFTMLIWDKTNWPLSFPRAKWSSTTLKLSLRVTWVLISRLMQL